MSNETWPKSFRWKDNHDDVITFHNEQSKPRCKSDFVWDWIPSFPGRTRWEPIPVAVVRHPADIAFQDEFNRIMQEHDGQRMQRELFAAEKRLRVAIGDQRQGVEA